MCYIVFLQLECLDQFVAAVRNVHLVIGVTPELPVRAEEHQLRTLDQPLMGAVQLRVDLLAVFDVDVLCNKLTLRILLDYSYVFDDVLDATCFRSNDFFFHNINNFLKIIKIP